MTRLCILGLVAAFLVAGPAWPAALDHALTDARPIAKETATELAFDEPARLPAGLLPAESRSCILGEQVTVSGTIADVERQPDGWSAGATARVDKCRGLTDASTGFAALFGEGKPPPSCEHGSRFWASGTIRAGFEPEFFLRVQTIKCE